MGHVGNERAPDLGGRFIDPPIILSDDGDLCVFDGVALAEQYVEAVDAYDGVYDAWDSRGTRLTVTADGGRVVIRAALPLREDGEGLRAVLESLLARVDATRFGGLQGESASLAQLVATLEGFERSPTKGREGREGRGRRDGQ